MFWSYIFLFLFVLWNEGVMLQWKHTCRVAKLHTHIYTMHACTAMPDLQGKAGSHACCPCSRLLSCLTGFLAVGPDDDHSAP